MATPLTLDQICEQVLECCGAPDEEFFRKAVIRFLCHFRDEGIPIDATLNSVDVEVITRCDVIDESTTVKFLRILKFNPDASIDAMDIDFSGETYVIEGTETDCPLDVQGAVDSSPIPQINAMLATLCDVQSGDTVRFLRFIIKTEDSGEPSGFSTQVIDTELDGETPYIPTGEISDCPITVSANVNGEQYAGPACYDNAGTVQEAIRFALIEEGLFTGDFRFVDATTGSDIDVGDVVECPVPGGIYDVFPTLDNWPHNACQSSEVFIDDGTLDEKIAANCFASSYRVTFSVDGVELYTDRLIGFNNTAALDVLNPVTMTPEPLDGVPQALVNLLNGLTNPYIQWFYTTDDVDWFIQYSYAVASSFVFSISRVDGGCAGTSDPVDTYVLEKDAGVDPEWTEPSGFEANWSPC